ncbi:MAG: hypothetical protein WC841_01055 [Candidatus Shapirobacteria bacterium]
MKSLHGKDVYSFMTILSSVVLLLSLVLIWPDLYKARRVYVSQTASVPLVETITLSGTVVQNVRPAPDINYDFALQLDEPFVNELSAQGSDTLETSLVLIGATEDIQNQIASNIDSHVSVTATLEWGYAESQYLKVLEIK